MEGDHPHSATYFFTMRKYHRPQANEVQTTGKSLCQIGNMTPKEKYKPYVLSLALDNPHVLKQWHLVSE